MPLPRTKNVSTLIRFLRKEHPDWEMKKVIAVALSTARQRKVKAPKERRKRR